MFDTYRSREITIAELLSQRGPAHRANLLSVRSGGEKDGKPGAPPTLQGAVAKFGEEGPVETPGATFSYSNAGFNTLGAIVEKASGLPLEAFLKSRIYDPLGMTDSLNHEDPAKLARMATVYRGKQVDGTVEWTQGFVPDDAPDFPVVRASGGLISTAMDYGRFLQMFLNGGTYGDARVLTPESIAAMTAPHANAGKDGRMATAGSSPRAASTGTAGPTAPTPGSIRRTISSGSSSRRAPAGSTPARNSGRLSPRPVAEPSWSTPRVGFGHLPARHGRESQHPRHRRSDA